MLSGLTFALAGALVGAASLPEECRYSLEIMHLQDQTDSFKGQLGNMTEHMKVLIPKILEDFPGATYAYSKFTDKPLPGVGFGAWGGYSSQIAGTCYRMEVDFTDDVNEVVDYLEHRASAAGGNDGPEAQYEALIRGALSSKWTPPEVTHNPVTGDPIARVMLMITDANPHLGNTQDAQKYLDYWNTPRTWAGDRSTGGFGSHQICESSQWMNPSKMADCLRLADLYKLYDDGTITATEEAERVALVGALGPEKWEALAVHPGDDTADCAKTEYPTYEQVLEVYKHRGIKLLVLVANEETSDVYAGWKWVIDDLFGAAEVAATLAPLNRNATDFYDVVTESLQGLATKICEMPTSTAEPTTEGTGSTTTTTESTTTSSTEAGVVDSSEAAGGNGSSEAAGGEESSEPAGGEGSSEAAGGEGSSEAAGGEESSEAAGGEGTTTTDGIIVVPPPAPAPGGNGGSKTGVIAGAAAGAVAVIAGAGVVLAKYMGWGMFAKTSSPEVTALEQVDTPETPVEREAMEDVAVDMFA